MNKDSDIDFEIINDEIEEKIDEQLKDLEEVKVEAKEIGNPKKLVDSISQIVWEQFVLQIAGQAGEDFIKQNNNLNLSLKKADHFLDSESFGKGILPSHNSENISKYQQRYNSNYKNFVRDENGNIVTHKTRMGTEEATLTKKCPSCVR